MLGNFLKKYFKSIFFLKTLKLCILIGNSRPSDRQVESQVSPRGTRQLAWIHSVCISIKFNPVLTHYRLSIDIQSVTMKYCAFHVLVQTNFARSSSNSPQSFQRFRQTLRRNFNWVRQQMKNFPIDPH